MGDETRLKVFGRFTSRYVPGLSAVANLRDPMDSRYEGIQVEPCPDGGVMLVASSASLLVWAHDPAGKASQPFVLSPCKRFVAACTPPELPEAFDSNGDTWDIPAPEWITPHEVMVIADSDGLPGSRGQIAPVAKGYCSTHVVAKALPPDLATEHDDESPLLYRNSDRIRGGTQTIDRKLLPWGKVVPSSEPVPVTRIALSERNLHALSLLSGGVLTLRFYGDKGPVVIDFADDPNLHAAVMPCNLDELEADAERAAAV